MWAAVFLLKLKDIAAVPVAASWLRSRPRITTRLIERLCDESSEAAPISVDDTCTHWWPVVSSEAYEECFVTPVQRAVIKVGLTSDENHYYTYTGYQGAGVESVCFYFRRATNAEQRFGWHERRRMGSKFDCRAILDARSEGGCRNLD